MPRKKSKSAKLPVVVYRYRDPKTNKLTEPNGRKILIRETHHVIKGKIGKRLATKKGKFHKPPDLTKPPTFEGPSKELFSGSNRGMRFDDMLIKNKVLGKLSRSRSRKISVEIETVFQGTDTKLRTSKTILLARKGKNKTQQNLNILVKALRSSLDGKGIKLYARKHLTKLERRRYSLGDWRKTKITIKALK